MKDKKGEYSKRTVPPKYKAVRVWLSDGSKMLGMWTGTKWWSKKGQINPVKWELEARKKKKTEKLLEALPESERPHEEQPPETAWSLAQGTTYLETILRGKDALALSPEIGTLLPLSAALLRERVLVLLFP